MRFEMEGDIAGEQHKHQHHHGQVAPVVAGDDFTGCCTDNQLTRDHRWTA